MERASWMSILAQSDATELAQLAAPWLDISVTLQRAPEIGTAMVRGLMGGTGGSFNLGEVTVVRCSVSTQDGLIGHAYVQGRDKSKAKHCAVLDALLQGPDGESLKSQVIEPLQASLTEKRQIESRKAAATQVDFFTLARGED
jgi:alpha-D-ribose 1-methylphosphonate 5-triphosphate synthase subunit PhnG